MLSHEEHRLRNHEKQSLGLTKTQKPSWESPKCLEPEVKAAKARGHWDWLAFCLAKVQVSARDPTSEE